MLSSVARLARRGAARRSIATGDNLLKVAASDLQPARTWDAAEADGFAGASMQTLFAGRKVVLFALPGAFTGVCERGHVPSFATLVGDFKAKGVDEVICVSVNDPYCMNAWATQLAAEGVAFYGDADGSFTRAVGAEWDCNGDALGPAKRSNRYACVVDDGIVGACFVEQGPGDLEVSDGATLLGALSGPQSRTGRLDHGAARKGSHDAMN